MAFSPIPVFVKSIRHEAEGISSFELRPADGHSLPGFTAGAHITVDMAAGISRSYSLVNSQEETHRYVIAVSRDRASRGGSRYMHDSVKVGDVLHVSAPRNNFPLFEGAARSVLIAGGIGITPLWNMARRLYSLGADWDLHYAARSRRAAAFVHDMASLGPEAMQRIHLHFDDEADERKIDLGEVLDVPPDVHVYCCGPIPMLRAFEAASASRPRSTVHTEYFLAPETTAPTDFVVRLAKNGAVITVPECSSILDELLRRGIDVPYSCREGTCGTCETRVLDGIPDHRDVVLSEDERRSNAKTMICCSRALSPELVLDL
jgi:vanillate O-demethylase ferredoxin subunit